MGWILLVTWFGVGTQPDSYQVMFAAADRCAMARQSIIAEQSRLLNNAVETRNKMQQQPGVLVATLEPTPYVSAVCVPK